MGRTHHPRLELRPAPPADVDAGAEVRFRVEVACPSGCNLAGQPVRILASDGVAVREARLTAFEEAVNRTEEVILQAPRVVGAWGWRAVFPAELEGIGHDEASLPVRMDVRSHTTSLAVWDVASPLVVGLPARFKAGVKCSAGCALAGQAVEIADAAGARVGGGALGVAPWPGTAALYWTECEMAAPANEGAHSRTVRFPVPNLDLPHEPAVHALGLIAVRPPEHTVTVRVVEKGAGTPVEAAEVRFGAFRGRTDAAGIASLELPKGAHALHVWKEGYALAKETVDVQEDRTVRIEIEAAPEPEEEYWM